MDQMEEEKKKIVPPGCSVGRVVNCIIAVDYLLIMVTSLVTVGILGSLNLALSNFPDHTDSTAACPLYVYCADSTREATKCDLLYKGYPACLYVEASYGIIALYALVFFVVQIIRVIFRFNLWFTALVDLLLAFLAGLGCLAAAIATSVGLKFTCDKVNEHYSSKDCNQLIPDHDGHGDTTGSTGQLYYDLVNAVQGATWMCLLFIFIIFVISIVRVAIFFRRRKAGVPIDTDETVLTAADDFDDKPED